MERHGTQRAAAAHPAEADFWPADSLVSWRDSAESAFNTWLAQQRILGIRQFRASSKETYFAMFATWVDFLLSKKMSLLEATGAEGSEFFSDKQLVPVSRRRYLQLLDKVYLHLTGIGWDGEHPLKGLLRQERELDIPLPKGLTEDQLARLVVVLTHMTGTKAPRDRAMAALMVGAGLRSSEVIALRKSDLDASFGIEVKSLTVHLEHSTIVLPDGPWRHWLSDWQQERLTRRIPGDLLCPATAAGKGYTPSGLYRRIEYWFDLAGVKPEQGGVNVLRNTFARLALAGGRYTVEQVQGFMGHEELRTTQRHQAINVPALDGAVALNLGAHKNLIEHATEDRPAQVHLFFSGSGRG